MPDAQVVCLVSEGRAGEGEGGGEDEEGEIKHQHLNSRGRN